LNWHAANRRSGNSIGRFWLVSLAGPEKVPVDHSGQEKCDQSFNGPAEVVLSRSETRSAPTYFLFWRRQSCLGSHKVFLQDLVFVHSQVSCVVLDEGLAEYALRQNVIPIHLNCIQQTDTDFGRFGDLFQGNASQLALTFQVGPKSHRRSSPVCLRLAFY